MTVADRETPLLRKLGIAEGTRLGVFTPPVDVAAILGELPMGATLAIDPEGGWDLAMLFATSAASLEAGVAVAVAHMPPDGALWIAWPKRASRIDSDVTEQALRDLCLPLGLVDNKVCAIDDTWSGLRFVVRRERRSGWPGGTR